MKKIKNKKIKFYINFIIILSIICVFTILQNSSFAATPKLVNKVQDAFSNIKSWLIKIATPAAAVAVGTGVFMKKFSFGDEERLRMGKKVIKTSLFSYAFILGIDLILSAIQSLI